MTNHRKNIMYHFIYTVTLLLLLFIALPAGFCQADINDWPQDLKSDLKEAALAVADNWVDDRNPEKQDWAWGEGVLAYGLIKTADWSNKQEYFNFITSYIEHHQSENTEIEWSDHTTPAMAALYISRFMDENNKIYPISERVINYIMNAPRTNTQGMLVHLGYKADDWAIKLMNYPDAWIDSLFHITPSLVMYSSLTGNEAYINEAAHQIKLFIQNMRDPVTGLMAHAYYDYPENEVVPAFSNYEFWARGNSWLICSLVELLKELPVTHPDYYYLRDAALDFEQSLRANQGEDGRFHTLLTKPGTYYETAGTALILYAMASGYEQGLFGEETRSAVLEGAQGLLSETLDWHHNNTQADVTKISIGTNPSPGLYRFVPRQSQVSYGVGAWLMFASVFAD